jgi:hypothetical protein
VGHATSSEQIQITYLEKDVMAEEALMKESLLREICKQEVPALLNAVVLQYIAIHYGIPIIIQCNEPWFDEWIDNLSTSEAHIQTGLGRIENSHRPTTNTTLLRKVDCL